MKIEKVYTEGGECLGDEYVNLSHLQGDTKKAILQLIYLDETVDIYAAQNAGPNPVMGGVKPRAP